MIPADRIAIDGDKAWWVVNSPTWKHFDRPCGTCDGRRWSLGDDTPGLYDAVPCKDCSTGRHTFEIEVEEMVSAFEGKDPDVWNFTASVVPGMVLPIVGDGNQDWDLDSHVMAGQVWIRASNPHAGPYVAQPITLPDAAKPGDWAVQLLIHNPKAPS